MNDFDDAISRVPRREFIQWLGAGLLISVLPLPTEAQNAPRGRRGGTMLARVHVAANGAVTVLTGKIEMGQGARAELTQAAAEELRLAPDQVRLVMGDTDLVPDDGLSAGSRTTPSTVPAVRQGAAAAREALKEYAAKKWGVDKTEIVFQDGRLVHGASNRTASYGELAAAEDLSKALDQPIPANVELTPVKDWKVLGVSYPRPNLRDLVTGTHPFPSDYHPPGMLYGKVLRPPAIGAKLKRVDLAAAKAMKDVVVAEEEGFVGVAAPTTARAREALETMAKTAVWDTPPQPSSEEIYDYLRKKASARGRDAELGPVAPGPTERVLSQTYHAAYIQHAPMETRTALASWDEGKLTVWTGTQNPFGYVREVAGAMKVSPDQVRIVVPDFGGGFGGKHTAEAAIEAARLARVAGHPVMLKWTRAEEFTWACFRPAAVMDIKAVLGADGTILSWEHVTINAGGSALDTPYHIARKHCPSVNSESPLRQGSYRGLAATANNFARESAMDELAVMAGKDPLEFRLAHLDHPRLRAVLETAAEKFGWKAKAALKGGETGVGLACGTEKGSYVAACVEVTVDRDRGRIQVKRVCEAFECGAVLNPANLRAQIQGCIIMGIGPALWEEMKFAAGQIQNAAFGKYRVPRMDDVPELDIHVLDRSDLASVGAGETPLIAVAPAIANAVFQLTGKRIRRMPMVWEV